MHYKVIIHIFDAIAALAWLCIAGFFEWLKYKICNHDDTLNTLD